MNSAIASTEVSGKNKTGRRLSSAYQPRILTQAERKSILKVLNIRFNTIIITQAERKSILKVLNIRFNTIIITQAERKSILKL